MSSADTIERIIEQARNLLPGGTLSREIESNFRALLQAQLKQMDVVSRDEFDAQVAVLKRSREKIDELEQQLAALMEQSPR